MKITSSISQSLAVFLLLVTLAASCKKDKEEVLIISPKAANIEIGTANSKQGIRGRDFHFNADVIAADKIKTVEVKILPKVGQTYSSTWKFEIVWDQYFGAKNSNVHKHFTIPIDAPLGKYDFYFLVYDQNGTKLEIREDFTIVDH